MEFGFYSTVSSVYRFALLANISIGTGSPHAVNSFGQLVAVFI